MNDFSPQLPLNFKNCSVPSFANFLVAKNSTSINSLHDFLNSRQSLFYLWGANGSGKTHLLNAIALKLKQQKAVIIDYQQLNDRQNISLIEMFDCICLDNAQSIAGNQQLEEALFYWINEIRQGEKKIIIASTLSNNDPKWQLPDLISRLQSGRTHELLALERTDALLVFQQQAHQKGLTISSVILKYIEKNCSMNMSFLTQLLKKLDQITLSEKKQLTIPLLKKILQTELV